MSMARIRKQYSVPAKRGGTITYTGDPAGPRTGVITGSADMRLRVRFDDAPAGARTAILHPTWSVEYTEEAPA